MMKMVRAGKWKLGLGLLIASCGVQLVGSRFVKSQAVQAAEGGLITVSAAESSELKGMRLQLPPGALRADTHVTVELALDEVLRGGFGAGPAVVLGPTETELNLDAVLVLPVAQLGANDEVSILGIADDGSTFEIDSSRVTLDATRSLVTFSIRRFGVYQPRRSQPRDGGLDGGGGNCVEETECDVECDPYDLDAGSYRDDGGFWPTPPVYCPDGGDSCGPTCSYEPVCRTVLKCSDGGVYPADAGGFDGGDQTPRDGGGGPRPDGGTKPDGGFDGGTKPDGGVDGGPRPDGGFDGGTRPDGGFDGGSRPDGGVVPDDGGEPSPEPLDGGF